VAAACRNLGNCMLSTGEYLKAISYFQTQYAIAEELELEDHHAAAALDIGVAMRLHVRADRQAAAASPALRPAAGAPHVPGSRSSASARLDSIHCISGKQVLLTNWVRGDDAEEGKGMFKANTGKDPARACATPS